MRDDFNKPAMREKIRKNVDAGWTLEGILKALKEEKLKMLEDMRWREERVMELNDQIEFMETEVFKDGNETVLPGPDL